MTLRELIDLEARLALDARQDDAELRERDGAVASKLAVRMDDRAKVLRAWVAALLPTERASVGERAVSALAGLKAALFVLGLLLGAGAAAAALHYEGRDPVNVARFVFALIAPQLVLLVLGMALLALHTESVKLRGLIAPLLQRAWRWLALHGIADAKSNDELLALFGRIDARRSLSPGVERWTLVGVSQVFGIAFNVAALATCLALVAFTDLRFGWSSTLLTWDGAMTRMVHVLSMPWSYAWPDAVPSSELVRATRFYRRATTLDPEIAGQWWRFLVASLAVYGLAPRLLLASFASFQQRRALLGVHLDTPDVDAALHRLRTRHVIVSGPTPLGELPVPEEVHEALDAMAAKRWIAISWRDFPATERTVTAAISRTLDGKLGPILKMGGGMNQTRDALAALPTEIREGDGVLFLCETFEPPDGGLRATLSKLRALLGDRRRLVVGLVEHVDEAGRWHAASQTDVAHWRHTLDALADPYLHLEPLASAE